MNAVLRVKFTVNLKKKWRVLMVVTTAYLSALEQKAEISLKRNACSKIIKVGAKDDKIETMNRNQ